jgi:hypothetical protein
MDKNSSIKCTVDECKYHSEKVDYCTLNDILVGKHETKATDSKCTDCESFKVKEGTY